MGDRVKRWIAGVSAWMRTEFFRWAFNGILTALLGILIASVIVKLRAFAPTTITKDGTSVDWAQAVTLASEWILSWTTGIRFKTLLELLAVTTFAAILVRAVMSFTAIFRRALRRREALHSVGLSNYWAHWQARTHGGPWREICDRIVDPDNRILYILGASGIATFGEEGSPLFDLLAAFDGEIRIFLLDPNCDAVDQRSKDIKQKVGSYRDEIRTSIAQIKRLKRTRHNITLKLYDWLPNWKLVLTSDMAWLQYYRPQKSVEATPIYQFFSNRDHTTLYHVYYFEFVRLWASRPEHVIP